MPKLLVLDFDLTLVYPHTNTILMKQYGEKLKKVQERYPGSDAWKNDAEFKELQNNIYIDVKNRLNKVQGQSRLQPYGSIFTLINPQQIKELIVAAQNQDTVVAVASFTSFPGAIQAVLDHLGLNDDQLSQIEIEYGLPSEADQKKFGKVNHIRRLIARLLSENGKKTTELCIMDDDPNNIQTARIAAEDGQLPKTTAIQVPAFATSLGTEIGYINKALNFVMHAPAPVMHTPMPPMQTIATLEDQKVAQMLQEITGKTSSIAWTVTQPGVLNMTIENSLMDMSIAQSWMDEILKVYANLGDCLQIVKGDTTQHRDSAYNIPGGGFTIRADVAGIAKVMATDRIINILNTITGTTYVWAKYTEEFVSIAKENGSLLTNEEAEKLLGVIITKNPNLKAHLKVQKTGGAYDSFTIMADVDGINRDKSQASVKRITR